MNQLYVRTYQLCVPHTCANYASQSHVPTVCQICVYQLGESGQITCEAEGSRVVTKVYCKSKTTLILYSPQCCFSPGEACGAAGLPVLLCCQQDLSGADGLVPESALLLQPGLLYLVRAVRRLHVPAPPLSTQPVLSFALTHSAAWMQSHAQCVKHYSHALSMQCHLFDTLVLPISSCAFRSGLQVG